MQSVAIEEILKIENLSIASFYPNVIFIINLTFALCKTKQKNSIRINPLAIKEVYSIAKITTTNQNPQTKGGRASYLHENQGVESETNVC